MIKYKSKSKSIELLFRLEFKEELKLIGNFFSKNLLSTKIAMVQLFLSSLLLLLFSFLSSEYFYELKHFDIAIRELNLLKKLFG